MRNTPTHSGNNKGSCPVVAFTGLSGYHLIAERHHFRPYPQTQDDKTQKKQIGQQRCKGDG